MPETLPSAVRAFLREYIESYEQLEVLFLLRRQPDGPWSARNLADRMGHPLDIVEESLQGLARAGCIEQSPAAHGDVRYAPRDAGQKATIDALASAYEEKPLAVIKLMSANAIDRVRTAAIHTFADAFVIGRKKDG